ncbi:hypothetical protein BACCAP_01092 [Pseudoflavonifractor capillosus ATCC 29799]|uniref:Uncharacterized protein n=1 Tax=Pseudoflavonifractor capillosus ATCC 29799 TaxID=411467 RepID=A6NSB3_9FIRM|nr:hypothetical protein BACCAP_01092 [Pseudoflavonifractor capillosus ATCC 29799]
MDWFIVSPLPSSVKQLGKRRERLSSCPKTIPHIYSLSQIDLFKQV